MLQNFDHRVVLGNWTDDRERRKGRVIGYGVGGRSVAISDTDCSETMHHAGVRTLRDKSIKLDSWRSSWNGTVNR